MKKFYLLLVALLAAVSVNAAVEKLYLIGEIVGGWNPTNGQEMTKLSDGVFYADVTIEKDVNFGFTSVLGTSDSDWDPFNGARYGADTDGLTVAVENTYNANLGLGRTSGKKFLFIFLYTKNSCTSVLICRNEV